MVTAHVTFIPGCVHAAKTVSGDPPVISAAQPDVPFAPWRMARVWPAHMATGVFRASKRAALRAVTWNGVRLDVRWNVPAVLQDTGTHPVT